MKVKRKILTGFLSMLSALTLCVTSLASDGSNISSNKYQAYYNAIEVLNNKYDAHIQIEDEKKLDNFTVEEFTAAVEKSYIEVEDIDKGVAEFEVVPADQDDISSRSTSAQYCYLKGENAQYGRLGLQTVVNDSMKRYSTISAVWSEPNGWNTYFQLQSHSQSFASNYLKCNVGYTGVFYNQATGVILTVLRTYNVTYTCGGGNLYLFVSNI